MKKRALNLYGGEESAARAKVANLMLRYSLFRPNVDRLIIAMRKPEWIKQNILSYQKGSLTLEELNWLNTVSGTGEQT